MKNKTYYYTINHETKTICLPPPFLAGDIGSPPSWAVQRRSVRFKAHFEGYSVSTLTIPSWKYHIEKNGVLSINSDEMEKANERM